MHTYASVWLSSMGIIGMSLSWLFHCFYGLNLRPDGEAHTVDWVISAAFNVFTMTSKSTIKDLKSDPNTALMSQMWGGFSQSNL